MTEDFIIWLMKNKPKIFLDSKLSSQPVNADGKPVALPYTLCRVNKHGVMVNSCFVPIDSYILQNEMFIASEIERIKQNYGAIFEDEILFPINQMRMLDAKPPIYTYREYVLEQNGLEAVTYADDNVREFMGTDYQAHSVEALPGFQVFELQYGANTMHKLVIEAHDEHEGIRLCVTPRLTGCTVTTMAKSNHAAGVVLTHTNFVKQNGRIDQEKIDENIRQVKDKHNCNEPFFKLQRSDYKLQGEPRHSVESASVLFDLKTTSVETRYLKDLDGTGRAFHLIRGKYHADGQVMTEDEVADYDARKAEHLAFERAIAPIGPPLPPPGAEIEMRRF